MTAARIALSGWLIVAGLYAGTLLLTVGQPWAEPNEPLWLTSSLAFASIGGLICLRRPGNRIGVLFLVSGGLLMLSSFGFAYASRSLLGGADLPGAMWALWLWTWIVVPAIIALLVFLPLLFPDGQLLSRRWRPVAWLGVGLAAVASVALAVDPTPVTDMPFHNPFAVPALAPFSAFMRDTGFVFVPLLALVAIGSLVLRIRRSVGVERQQMKWFGYSFLLATLYILVVWGLIGAVLDVTDLHPLIELAGVGFLLLIPGSVAVAVLRYRLYEIDRIVSRTVSYALVAGVLAAVFAGGVLGIQAVLPASSDLAIAGSTLAVAALFNPLRRRVQVVVDRRFNRARYDAQQELERFSQRLSATVEIDVVSADLLQLIDRTLQPASRTIWMRGQP